MEFDLDRFRVNGSMHLYVRDQLKYSEGFAKGFAESIKNFKGKDIERLSRLVDGLIDQHRYGDVERLASDDAYRDELFRELGID